MKKRNLFALKFMSFILLVLLVVIVINSFFISVMGIHINSGANLKYYADNVSTQKSVLQAKRGLILDSEGNIIAEDVESYTLYAIVDENRPSYKNQASYVVDKEDTATKLSTILNAPYDYILNLLNSANYQTEFGLYGSKLSQEVKDQITALNLPGLGFTKSYRRDYPLNSFASYLVGFVSQDDSSTESIGKMGIESTFNSELAGIDGSKTSVVDRYGYTLPGYSSDIKAQEDGKTITLTIIKELQEQLESSFLLTKETFNATELFGGIMEVSTGKILALGQSPSFNPNLLDVTEFKNFATQFIYEPGSTMKTFTYAAAIDSGVYNGDATFNSSPFLVSLDKNGDPYRNLGSNALVIGTIRNAHNKSWGTITYNEGYAYSSNVGIASLLTNYLDLDTFQEYLIRFGFNETVNIYGLNEGIGNINFDWPYDKLTVGFGQGITVNMMQLMQAYTAIFNNGTMVKPYVVQSISDPLTSEIEYQAEIEVIGQPIQESTALQMQDLMYRVTQDLPTPGTARAYVVDGIDMLAKTGTAQIFVDGAYSNDEFIYSVMIGLPADHPQVMLYYAYRAPATLNAHFKTEAVQQLITKIAQVYNLKEEENVETVIQNSSITSYELLNFTNHSLDYAQNYLSDKAQNVYVLGNKTSVLAQYPLTSTQVLNNQVVYLLTDYTNIEMIDLTGLSLKDARAFADLVGLTFSYEGMGVVSTQSISATSIIESGKTLHVTLN